jgi:hypothetical protein
MGRNLSNLFISESFQYLVQYSGSELQSGIGTTLTGPYTITASSAVSSSYAVTASFALNAGTTVSTASLLTTASAVNNTITFTKGDSSTFNVVVATGSAVTVNTGSLMLTGSVSSNILTFTKGDGSTFSLTVATGSAVSASFASTSSVSLRNVLTASINNDLITFTKGDATTFGLTVNNVKNADSASVAVSSSFASSLANNLNITFANVTASNIRILGTASVEYLNVVFQSSSIIYASGSNQLGDAANDTQTLWGTVNIVTGPLVVTGSVNSAGGFTGSLQGNATSATTALTASYVVNSLTASNTPNAIITASVSNATITYTKGDGSTFATTVNNVVNATSSSFAVSASYAPSPSPFPFTGNAVISGSLSVSGSVVGNIVGNNTDTYTGSTAVQQIVTLTQAEYNSVSSSALSNTLYVISDSTGSNILSNTVITGSLVGNVGSISISSNTASMNLSTANFFTLQLVSGSVPLLNPTNISAGQTINLQVKQAASVGVGGLKLPSIVYQATGSVYAPTAVLGAVDILTFISFDTGSLYLSAIKQFISTSA